jgi:hypothetical protein
MNNPNKKFDRLFRLRDKRLYKREFRVNSFADHFNNIMWIVSDSKDDKAEKYIVAGDTIYLNYGNPNIPLPFKRREKI